MTAIRTDTPTFASALRGELWLAQHRPAPWVTMAIWAGCLAVFAYLVSYLVLGNPEWADPSLSMSEHYAPLLPAAVTYYPLASLPLYGAPQLAILGVILSAGDYSRGTLRTLLPRFPSRVPVIAARLLAVCLIALVAAVVTTGTGVVASLAVSAATGVESALPGVGALAAAIGIGWLVAWTFIVVGFAVGVAVRSLIGAIVVAAGWVLGVESLLIGMTAPLAPAVSVIQGLLPVGASSSLISSQVPDGVAIVPALAHPTGAGVGAVVLVGWILAAGLVSAWVFTRRDVE